MFDKNDHCQTQNVNISLEVNVNEKKQSGGCSSCLKSLGDCFGRSAGSAAGSAAKSSI